MEEVGAAHPGAAVLAAGAEVGGIPPSVGVVGAGAAGAGDLVGAGDWTWVGDWIGAGHIGIARIGATAIRRTCIRIIEWTARTGSARS